MKRRCLLDLYCGAGGAALGYHQAGFEVFGVDLHPMPRYPFGSYQGDALEALKILISGGRVGPWALEDIDAIHASPPCQRFSVASYCRPGIAATYPDLVAPTRFLLRRTGKPFVIENTPGAPLLNPVTLCGSQFRRVVDRAGHGRYTLKRHREFEAQGFVLEDAGPHDHSLPALTVAGHGNRNNRPDQSGPGYAASTKILMGIDWMRREELNEAVPPFYALWVGNSLISALLARNRAGGYIMYSPDELGAITAEIDECIDSAIDDFTTRVPQLLAKAYNCQQWTLKEFRAYCNARRLGRLPHKTRKQWAEVLEPAGLTAGFLAAACGANRQTGWRDSRPVSSGKVTNVTDVDQPDRESPALDKPRIGDVSDALRLLTTCSKRQLVAAMIEIFGANRDSLKTFMDALSAARRKIGG